MPIDWTLAFSVAVGILIAAGAVVAIGLVVLTCLAAIGWRN